MEIESIIQELTEGIISKRRIDGEFGYKNKTYEFKAYLMPGEIIRIDIKERKKND